MPPQQKENKSRQVHTDDLFLPSMDIVLPEKLDEIKNSMVFHEGMVKKIDTLLRKHEEKIILEELVSAQQPTLFPEEPFIEMRTPLSKKTEASTFQLRKKQDLSLYGKLTMPDEFKIDTLMADTPSFRFISTLDTTEDILCIKKPRDGHVEIIDLSSFAVDSGAIQKQMDVLSEFKKDTDAMQTKKINVIETKKSGSKKYKDTATESVNQSGEKSEKPRAYYLADTDRDDKKLKKFEKKHSYIPIDLDDARNKLKEKERLKLEKQRLEEEKRREKERIEREAEENRLKRLEAKKAKLDEKQKKKEEKKALLEKLKKEAEEKKLEKLKEKQERRRAKKKIGTYEFEERNEDVFPKNQKISDEPMFVNDDVIKVLLIIDDLLGELPESVIENFAQSKDFELYKKVIIKYKHKGEL